MNLSSYEKEMFEYPIGARVSTTYGNVQPFLHWHPHYEILIIKRGRYTITSNTINYTSSKPAVIIHRPYCLHKLNADENELYTRYIIHASKSTLKQFSPSLLDMSDFANANMLRADPSPKELDEISELCEALLKYGSDFINDIDLVQSALYTALIIYKTIKLCHSGHGEIYTSKYSYIQDVLQLVTENISESLTISELCEQFGVSHTKLLADFKSATGSTYKKYLTNLRQTHARELLSDGASIVNASLECGYSSEAHFVKAFREFWGMTPGEFIKSQTS